jgi:iron complex outermembrane receptor protein
MSAKARVDSPWSEMMMGTRACIALTVAISFGCILAVTAQQPAIQDASPADQRQGAGTGPLQTGSTLPRITVTGSIVPRIGEDVQPVVSLDRDYFERNGAAQTVSDALVRWPSDTNPFTPLVTAGNSFSPGGSSVNLRGLGPNRTLVLVDGRRVNAYPFPIGGITSFVDLNSIPLAAVDRIEILKDGGTATYGDDAVAGVVNIILKDEYNGADLQQYYGISQRGDDEVYHTQLVAGAAHNLTETSRFSLLAALDYYESSPILARDRWYSNVRHHSKFGSYSDQPTTPFGTAGQFTDATGNIYTLNPGVRGSATVNDFTVNTSANSNFSTEDVDLQAREQRYGAFVKAKYEPTPWLRFYEEFQYQRNEEVGVSPNGGISSFEGLIVPASNPYNPFGFAVQPAGQSLPELGAWRQDTTVDTYRTVTGFTLQLPKGWFIDGSFLYSEGDGDERIANVARISLVQAALNGVLPGREGLYFDPFVDEAANPDPNDPFRGRLTGTEELNVRSSLLTWSLRAGGEAVELPSGPIAVGGGIDYRSEEFIQANNRPSRLQVVPNQVIDGISVGPLNRTDFAETSFPGQLSNARRRVASLYGEVTVPLLGAGWSFPGARLLEFAFSERYDDYSDFGGAAKPKFALRCKPFDDFTIRASYSEGFVAPSLSQLFSAPIVGLAGVADPVTGFIQVPVSYMGNPHLKPETSYEYYLEGTWSPGATDPERSPLGFLRGLTVYGDWYQIQIRNVISQLQPQLIVDEPAAFPEAQVVRNAAGQITRINIPFVNLGALLTAGFEFGASYVTREFSWGKLDAEVNANYSYLYSRKQPANGGFRVVDLEDSFGLPDFKLTGSLFYSKTVFGIDTVRTGLSLNYVDSEHDILDNYKGTLPGATVQPNGLVHRIGSWTTVDWQVSYTFGRSRPPGPEMARPGYDKDGKRLAGEQAISPKPDASSKGVRAWLAEATLTFGINNLADTRPPFADTYEGYDTTTANPYQRYFYVNIEKKF